MTPRGTLAVAPALPRSPGGSGSVAAARSLKIFSSFAAGRGNIRGPGRGTRAGRERVPACQHASVPPGTLACRRSAVKGNRLKIFSQTLSW